LRTKKKRRTVRKKAGTRHRITHEEICNRPSRVDGAGNHHEELIGGDTVTHAGNKKRRERSHDRARDERYEVRPHWQRRLTFEHADKTYADVKDGVDVI